MVKFNCETLLESNSFIIKLATTGVVIAGYEAILEFQGKSGSALGN